LVLALLIAANQYNALLQRIERKTPNAVLLKSWLLHVRRAIERIDVRPPKVRTEVG